MAVLKRRSVGEQGASLVEYVLLLAMLCVVLIGGTRSVGISTRAALYSMDFGGGSTTTAGDEDNGNPDEGEGGH